MDRRVPRRVCRRPAVSFAALLLLYLAAAILSGCAGVGVQPWERDLLAQNAMAVDSDPVETALDAHIYFSKEASTGGFGGGGGGCGCN